MRKGSAEKIVRKSYTWPQSFASRVEILKQKRGAVSETEVLRDAVRLLEFATDPNETVLLQNKVTGQNTKVAI